MTTGYLLDNAHHQARKRFTYLEVLYDPVTCRNIEATGLHRGWRCLEVGAGGGSVARWLADRVQPGGEVTATELDPRWSNVGAARLLRHDITRDRLPGRFDLIHARLVLMHLPQRDEVLRRLVAALKPGGWLAVEELDPLTPYCPDPETATGHLINRVGDAFTAALERRGASNTRGRRGNRTLAGAGLVNVHNEGHLVVGTGGSPAAQLMQVNVTQVSGELHGITRAEIERYVDVLSNPETTFLMPVLFATRGQRPPAERGS